MTDYVLSRAADAHIQRIFRYSVDLWGLVRAERYVLDLHDAFETLSAFPYMGRDVGHLRPGYYRFERNRHAVFYKKTDDGILVVPLPEAGTERVFMIQPVLLMQRGSRVQP